jgi:hypothetical protein
MSIFDDIFDDGRTPEQRKEAWIAQRMREGATVAVLGHGTFKRKPVDRATAEKEWEWHQEEARKLREQKAKRDAAKARREAVNEANRAKIKAEWKQQEAERVANLSPEKRAEYDRLQQMRNEARVETARESVRYFQAELANVMRECGMKPDTAGRDQLVKALNHFANENEGERAAAAAAVERIRAKLGLSWSDLIVH